MRPGELLVYHHCRRGTIAQARRIARGHRATLLEGRHKFRQRIHGSFAANRLVSSDNLRALFLLHLDRNDLFFKATSVCSFQSMLVTLQSETVLLLACHPEFLGDNLGLVTHMDIFEGAPE